MKKFKHIALLLLTAVVVFGCSKYDDTELRNDVSNLQSRVEKLEKWCETANSQITALQGLVTALQGNDYVTGVTPVMEGTTEVGYTITFTKSNPITIMHGKNGANGNDGTTPIIGVKKHTDGLYYWTIQTGSAEAVWMTDADGNMIPTTGKDGGAGQKPVISVAKDGDRYYWQVDGEWLKDADGNKVPATGDKGDTGAAGSNGTNGTNGTNGEQGAQGEKGDSFFNSVTPDTANGTVVIKLANGTEFTLPMLSTAVSFEDYAPLKIAVMETETEVKVILPATLKKADFAAIKADITNVAGTNSAITRTTTERWMVALTAPTFKQDGTLDAQPTVKVTVPATATLDEIALLEVTVVDAKGNKSTSTRVLYYNNQIAVTGVTVDPVTLTVEEKKTETLTVTVVPTDASNKNVIWTSNDATVATVEDGEVTGVKVGTVTITATTEDGSFTATCEVTVTKEKMITWAEGNLVADGANGAKVGAATDGGLFFQFGSLVGWSPTGNPTIAVKPVGCTVTSWNSSWTGDPATDDAVTGQGDPCRYYLGDTWRLPTNDEYVALFKDHGYPSTGPWKWDATSKSATHTGGLTFPASGYRYDDGGNLYYVGTNGYYWSSSPHYTNYGRYLYFDNSSVKPNDYDVQAIGLSVRCVRESN